MAPEALGVQADVPPRPRPLPHRAERRPIFERLRPAQADTWTERSPLVEVEFS